MGVNLNIKGEGCKEVSSFVKETHFKCIKKGRGRLDVWIIDSLKKTRNWLNTFDTTKEATMEALSFMLHWRHW
jgi:hypothetical protein